MTHDCIPPRHALDTNRQNGGDDRRQTLRHRRDCERHAQNQHVEKGWQPAHVFDQDDRRNHHNRDDDNDEPKEFAYSIELTLERGLFVWRLFQESGDAPHLGVHPRCRDDGFAVPIGGRSAAEDHVVPVTKCNNLSDRTSVLRNGQAFTGQCGFGCLKRCGFDQSRIRGNRVAFLDEDDVPGRRDPRMERSGGHRFG